MPKVEILVDNKIKCGFQDENENWIIKPNYDDIYKLYLSGDCFFAVKIENNWGVIDQELKWIIEPAYENISTIDTIEGNSWDFLVTLNGKQGVVDCFGSTIIEPKFDLIYMIDVFFDLTTYLVKLNNKVGIISECKTLYVEPIFDEIIPDKEDILLSSCIVKLNDVWGRIRVDGNFITEREFQLDNYRFMKTIREYNNFPRGAHKKEISLFSELESLIGLAKVKQEIRDIYSYVKNQENRKDNKLKTQSITHHMVFYGPPGTGKTTVARIVAKMFKELGILKKGHFIEADRSQLVGEYLGQTAPKVNQIVDKALDGILFIDEAYSLFSKQEDIFAKEAVNTLIKRIEDDRDRLIVIMAGYKEQMDIFIESNPGFKSRFNNHIYFENYNAFELLEIFENLCSENDYIISPLVEDAVLKIIENELTKNEKAFDNGRYIRNLFETITKKQSRRLGSISSPSKDELQSIEIEDLS